MSNEDFKILSIIFGILMLIIGLGFGLLNNKLNQKLENQEKIIARLDLVISTIKITNKNKYE